MCWGPALDTWSDDSENNRVALQAEASLPEFKKTSFSPSQPKVYVDQTKEMNGQADTISTDVPSQTVLVEPQHTVTTRPQRAGSR